MPQAFTVPATGTIAYQYFYIPTNFSEAKYVQAIETRPGNREVVHHVLVNYIARPDMTRTPVLKMNQQWNQTPDPVFSGNTPKRPGGVPVRLIATYAPGTRSADVPSRHGASSRAGRHPRAAGALHGERRGGTRSDEHRQSYFSKDPAPREIRASAFFNGTLVLPAGSSHTAVPGEVGFQQDTLVYGLLPHTHLRGTRWEYTMILPDGTEKPILLRCREASTSTGRPITCSPSRCSRPRARRSSRRRGMRQLGGQQTQSRSQGRRPLGRSDVGGDAIHGHPVQSRRAGEAGRAGSRQVARAPLACAAAALVASFAIAPAAAHDPITTAITFDREIRAILQARCASCHAAGGPAPMPLTTYDEVRPWARAVKDQILARRMPKWSAAHGYGAFAGDPSLTPAEMATVAAWVDGGQPKGTARAVPAVVNPIAAAFRHEASPLAIPAAAAEATLTPPSRWIGGWTFEPGDPLITSAAFSSADGTPIGTWVAGDAPVQLPSGSGIRVTAPIHVQLQRRTLADYEKPAAPARSILRLLPRAVVPTRRVWVEQTRCGAPRTGPSAALLAVRPLLGDRASAQVWLERPGAPQVIVGWFKDVEALYPRTYWLARPLELSPESRIAANAPCLIELTLTSR